LKYILFCLFFLPVSVSAQSLEQLILQEFPKDPVMVLVAKAESGMRQFDKDGNVIVNKKTNDVGLFQISVKYHGETAKRLGLDIYTLEGNIAYTKYLLKTQGLNAWVHSRIRWLPHLASS